MVTLLKRQGTCQGYKTPLDRKHLSKGADITLIGLSYMTVECYKAGRILLKLGISAEVLDLRIESDLWIKM